MLTGVPAFQRRPTRQFEPGASTTQAVTPPQPPPASSAPTPPPRRDSCSPQVPGVATSDRLLQDSARASPAESRDPGTTTSLFPRSRSVSSPPPAPGPRPPAPAPCSPALRRSLSSPPPSLPPSLPPAPDPDLPAPFPLGSPALSRIAQRRQSQDSCSYPHSSSASVEDIPGILKNSSDAAASVPSQPDCRTPTKSILKVDGVTTSASAPAPASRSALSYEAVSSSSSTEDLARSFTDVIIDPLPSKGRRSAPEVIIAIRQFRHIVQNNIFRLR